jgi:hypothetical protein
MPCMSRVARMMTIVCRKSDCRCSGPWTACTILAAGHDKEKPHSYLELSTWLAIVMPLYFFATNKEERSQELTLEEPCFRQRRRLPTTYMLVRNTSNRVINVHNINIECSQVSLRGCHVTLRSLRNGTRIICYTRSLHLGPKYPPFILVVVHAQLFSPMFIINWFWDVLAQLGKFLEPCIQESHQFFGC